MHPILGQEGRQSRRGGSWVSGPVASLTWACKCRLGDPGARPEGQPCSPSLRPNSPTPNLSNLTPRSPDFLPQGAHRVAFPLGILCNPLFLPTPEGLDLP